MFATNHFVVITYSYLNGVAQGMLPARSKSRLSLLRGTMSQNTTIHSESGGSPAANNRRQDRRRRPPRYERLSDGGGGSGRALRSPVRRVGRFEAFAFRIINNVVAIVALVFLAPVILIIAILIRIDSPGSVFYRQVRVGLDRRNLADEAASIGRRLSDIGGQPFEIFKFRTMRIDAEVISGPVWAADDDPRVTRVGRLLRRTRLDEIPQFWNVLRGEMSIVGPRPERPTFVRQLRDEIVGYPLRQQVPPGITGWAQVNRPPDQTVDDVRTKVDFDLEYLKRRSVWFDLWIMLKTLPVMFERDNSGSSE
jgi:lipopolysaccharide/colanic/teichoic acid biosynthesis glycosyltransferase